MKRWVLVACLLGLLITAEASAQVTQTQCTITWTVPSTYEDGTALTEPVTVYKIYIQQTPSPVPAPGTTAPIITVTAPTPGTAAPTSVSCIGATGLGPGIMTGQNYAWVTATVAGGESALSAPYPFTWSVAGAPPPPPARKSSPPGALKVQ